MVDLKIKVRKFSLILIIGILLSSCVKGFGKKHENGNLEIYYTESVGINYVESLSQYYAENNLIGDEKQSIQLTTDTEQFLLRLVSLESETEESKRNLELLEKDLANTVFKDRKFKIQLCDAFFNPKKG